MITRCYLEITNVCNLDCVFCPKTDRAKHTLTLEEFDVLTSRLKGEVRFLYFHLMGEPFLHPQLPQFVRMAREKGFTPVLTTNGTLLSRRTDMLEELPHKVQISLHSHEGNGKSDLREYIGEVMTFAMEAASRGCIIVLRLWNEGGHNTRTRPFWILLPNISRVPGRRDTTDGNSRTICSLRTTICLSGPTCSMRCMTRRKCSAMRCAIR